ncbi:MAG: helix-turn-helix domain-containing protein [Pseudonocardiaceae bacterium]
MATPTIQRRRLGKALKRARDQAGKTQEEAAAVVDGASSKISRIELGQSGVKQTDLMLLLDFYGVRGEQVEGLRGLARAGRQRGRWSGYRNVVPDWFRDYVDLEADASEIRWYQPEVVPGILQTEAYIHAMNASAHPRVTDDEVSRHVKVRLERQAILDQPDITLNFILSESALLRNVGDVTIMHQQLLHLAGVAERPNVELQILPFDAQTFGETWIDFIILRFDHDATSDVIYLEDYTDADYLDAPEAVQAYTALWSRLSAAAMGQVESRNLIIRLADEKKARS